MGNSTVFSKLDLKDYFFQLPIDEESQNLTAFYTPNGIKKYTVLPQGIKTASAEAQRLLTGLFAGYLGLFISVFIDDLIVYSKSFTDHLNDLRIVFDILRGANLKASAKKCQFAYPSVEYLGYEISERGIKPTDNYIADIAKFPVRLIESS